MSIYTEKDRLNTFLASLDDGRFLDEELERIRREAVAGNVPVIRPGMQNLLWSLCMITVPVRK